MIQSATPPNSKSTLSGLQLFAASSDAKRTSTNISDDTAKRMSLAKNVLRTCSSGSRKPTGAKAKGNLTAEAAALFATGTEEAETLGAVGNGEDALRFDATKLAAKALSQHPPKAKDDEINALAATPSINDLALKLVDQKKKRNSTAGMEDDIDVEEDDAAKTSINDVALQLVHPPSTRSTRTSAADIGIDDIDVEDEEEGDNNGSDDNLFEKVDIDEDSDPELGQRPSRTKINRASSTSSKRERRSTRKPRSSKSPIRSNSSRSPPPKTDSRSKSPPPRANSSGIRQRTSHRGHSPRRMTGALSAGSLSGSSNHGTNNLPKGSNHNAAFPQKQQRQSVSPSRAPNENSNHGPVCRTSSRASHRHTSVCVKTEQIANAQLRNQSICAATQQLQLVQDLEALELPPEPAPVKYKGMVASYAAGPGTGSGNAAPAAARETLSQADKVAAAAQATAQQATAATPKPAVARASIMAPMVNATAPKKKPSGPAVRSGAACGPPTREMELGEFADLEDSFLISNPDVSPLG